MESGGLILLIDNYDSFVFNLAHRLRELGEPVEVVRNDAISIGEVCSSDFTALVLSPGPGRPEEAGICIELLQSPLLELPTLGVCLGHQAIAAAFGGQVVRQPPVHGRASLVEHDGSPLFAGLANPFPAARYHSLAVAEPLPQMLRARAWCGQAVMGLEHRFAPIHGVQFHPESILTDCGSQLLANFLQIARASGNLRLVEPAHSG